MITPNQEVPQLAKELGISGKLYFKREDLHPYGSHKGRSIPYMIEAYARGGVNKFAISSSGNAALAAALYINEYNQKFAESQLSLQIFVGENINDNKLQVLKAQSSTNPQISITQTETPKQEVHKLNKKGEAKALRQSNDDLALIGYKELADELSSIQNLASIFVPTSSGTTAQALTENLPGVQIHIAQTSACHPIVELFDPRGRTVKSEHSMADAIVDQVALRKDKLLPKLADGWIVSDEEIEKAIKLTKQTIGLDISPNSALSVAALTQALANGWQPLGTIVCLITGR